MGNTGHSAFLSKGGKMDTESRAIFFAGIFFLTGMILGLGTGILLAPQPGNKTRRRLGQAVEERSQQVGKWVEEAKESAQDLADEGKRLASRLRS